MTHTLTILFIITLLSNWGCAGNKLSTAGRKVSVEHKGSLGKKCSAVGRITEKNKDGLVSLAHNRARNKAASMDANTITFDEEITNGREVVLHATAFNCP